MWGWFKVVFLPWLVIKDVRNGWLVEIEEAKYLVEKATKLTKMVKYVTIEKQDEESIPYLEEISNIASNECFVFMINECRQTLLDQLTKVGSVRIEKHTAKIEGDDRVEIVTIEDPVKEIERIKYMMSGIDSLELRIAGSILKLSQLRVGANNG